MSNYKVKPHRKLRLFLEEILKLEQRKLKKLDNLPKTVRNNDEKKVRWLDNLFEGMANLIYFFEFVNAHPELLKRFDDDIEDLLGLKPTTDTSQAAFPRFIGAVIGEGLGDFDDKRYYYRYRVLKIMQFLINQKAIQYYTDPDNPDYQRDTTYKDEIWRNLRLVEMYMRLADKFTADKKRPSRVMGFPPIKKV